MVEYKSNQAHEGMEKNDFIIGQPFWTATGKWICTDIGTRTIVAKKVNQEEEVVFDGFDFGGCSKKEF